MDTPRNFTFPDLIGWEPTRDTLGWYAKAVGAIPRILSTPHPKWWHISLKVRPEGLITESIPLPNTGGGKLTLFMDLKKHVVRISSNKDDVHELAMTDGRSATEFGTNLLNVLTGIGITGDFDPTLFDDNLARDYNPDHAEAYLRVIKQIADILQSLKSELPGDTGPVQLWPHHFDLAFEWFGTKKVYFEEEGQRIEYPSQINFGFAPGDERHPGSYFYSNPWPFHELLLSESLPSGARWHIEGWDGSILEYTQLRETQDPRAHLTGYYRRVFDLASPLLLE